MLQSISLQRHRFTIVHVLSYPIVWLGLIVVLATPALVLGTIWAFYTITPDPADVFMQSVAKRDGGLGWHQLCPALQAQVPLSELASQAEKQHIAESRQGMMFTVDFVGADARPQGGQIRVYALTMHQPHRPVEQRTYIVYTQASGCVEDVKNF
jgi:hypothetical protein